jgi:hypothetical protein
MKSRARETARLRTPYFCAELLCFELAQYNGLHRLIEYRFLEGGKQVDRGFLLRWPSGWLLKPIFLSLL